MADLKFHNLMLLIFNQTFGILKNKNAERYGAFPHLFPTYQLGRDLNSILENKPIRDPNIYIAAIDEFFSDKNPECMDKMPILLEQLEAEGYLSSIKGPDIFSKCDKNTLNIYKKLILDIWNFYYSNYALGNKETKTVYSIPQDVLDSIIQKYTEFRLPVSLNFYQQRIPDIMALLRTKDPANLYTSLETEYVQFFKNVLENNLFYTLSREEKKIFFNALYAVSDILNRTYHKDAYKIDLEILTFLNEIYDDNYSNVSVDDIRRIQGCIYAISIENTTESLQGNLKLTPNKNLTRTVGNYESIQPEQKLYMCDKALRNLLNNKFLKKLDQYFEEANYIDIYENRLRRKRDISPAEIHELVVLSLVYSNIACCSLQYIKKKIQLATKYNEYVEVCEIYHNRSGYIRNLLVRINQMMYGKDSDEYKNALHFMATYYHSIATRYYYTNKYANTIAIRSVLHSFYTELGLKEKARIQLELTPIDEYEQSSGDEHLYGITTKSFFEKHIKDFSYLFTKEATPYNTFRNLVKEYQKFKEFF